MLMMVYGYRRCYMVDTVFLLRYHGQIYLILAAAAYLWHLSNESTNMLKALGPWLWDPLLKVVQAEYLSGLAAGRQKTIRR